MEYASTWNDSPYPWAWHGSRGNHHGHGQFDQEEYEEYQPPKETRYIEKMVPKSHFQPGGPNGRPGSVGDTSSFPLCRGQQGEKGSYYIHIYDQDHSYSKEGQLSTHKEPYQLALALTNVSPRVGEPGERITLRYAIQNKGLTMDSPRESMPLKFELPDRIKLLNDLNIPGAIKPKEKRVVEQMIELDNSECSFAYESPYNECFNMNVSLMNTCLDIPYAKSQHTIAFRYPVTVSYKDRVLAVKNISDKPLGIAVQRALQLLITNSDHEPIDAVPIDILQAGSTHCRSLDEINFGSFVWFDTPRKHYADLYLQPIKHTEPLKLKLIQQVPMMISPLYKLKLLFENTHSEDFFEPGEEVALQYAVKNTSATHTSPDEKMQIHFEYSDFISSNKGLDVQGSIAPNAFVRIEEVARVQFKTIIHNHAEPFETNWSWKAHLISQTGTYAYAHYDHQFKVRYPVTFILPEEKFYTSPGTTTPLQMVINNNTNSPITRVVQLKITDENQNTLETYQLDSIPAKGQIRLLKEQAVY